ncbi:leucine-rich repeat containing protein, partial [Vairimorpha apis BRL 01]
MYSNNISKLPENIGNLKNLKFLRCRNLNAIEEISLSNNKIKNLPNSINNLKNLIRLHLNNNKLTEFTDDCEGLIKLTNLHLSNNLLTNFSRVCKIKSLEILNLSTNNIILFLPKELLRCTKLKKLILYNNQIQRIPIELLGILSNLDCLDLKQNSLEIYGTSTELGLNELVKELGFKLSVDDIEINKVYQFLDSKPISFNFENLRKCRITSLTEHIISEQELLNKINN